MWADPEETKAVLSVTDFTVADQLERLCSTDSWSAPEIPGSCGRKGHLAILQNQNSETYWVCLSRRLRGNAIGSPASTPFSSRRDR